MTDVVPGSRGAIGRIRDDTRTTRRSTVLGHRVRIAVLVDDLAAVRVAGPRFGST
ncbi:hypothetical protein [Streptomyces griseorubiginosus]|uniref:hypothetical protein n=1 Tax=Streptomyces griseorubiginosus TaxID=67304 RepID=UPI002E81C937|nr:hypothetical protein [Streptomyces griseorubiginosus]WUB43230.1 hypothetical protein OHN19_07750 [Streptomyces griseorubiginosus]WUB51748.1 hypothetical protein OG942_07745 [Streptomyces griseorubiginosus]